MLLPIAVSFAASRCFLSMCLAFLQAGARFSELEENQFPWHVKVKHLKGGGVAAYLTEVGPLLFGWGGVFE